MRNREKELLRREQTKKVMALIGPLLDDLDGLSNDTRGVLEEEAPELFDRLADIQKAMTYSVELTGCAKTPEIK